MCNSAAMPPCWTTPQRFDGLQAARWRELELTQAELKAAFDGLPPVQRDALQAAARTGSQLPRGAEARPAAKAGATATTDGTLLGQKVTPLDRVGIYVPGGKAAYPSVGADERHSGPCGRCRRDHHGGADARAARTNALVLAAAAYVAGVTRAFTIGGAQAVAALAYGTATIPKVDKITGPGNAYVASAKRRVFGTVGIDMIAGPSEILVLADGTHAADWVAMDLFSQAEHDELAQSILLCPDAAYIDAVQAAIDRLLPEMPRARSSPSRSTAAAR